VDYIDDVGLRLQTMDEEAGPSDHDNLRRQRTKSENVLLTPSPVNVPKRVRTDAVVI